MKTVYLVQHPAEGRVTSHVFASPPTELQLAAVKREMDRRHADALERARRNGAEDFLKVVEITLVEGDEVPSFGPPQGTGGEAGVAQADSPDYVASGTGHVDVITRDDVGTVESVLNPK